MVEVGGVVSVRRWRLGSSEEYLLVFCVAGLLSTVRA